MKQIFVHLHHSLDVILFLSPGWFSLHVAGLSVGVSVSAQVDVALLRPRLVLVALGAPAGPGPGAVGASARVEGVLVGHVLAQHDHPVLQVADRAHRAAGGAVQAPLFHAKLPLYFQHCRRN